MSGSTDESIEMGTFSEQKPEVSKSSFVETPNMIYTASGKGKERSAKKRTVPITVQFPPAPSVPITGTRFSVASVDIPMDSYQLPANLQVEKSKENPVTRNQTM